jgi:hypothetical protein
MGITVESLLIVERPAGEWLSHMDLDALSDDDRERLFSRLGGTLRRVDQSGLYHKSASTNHWWIATGLTGGPVPMLVEVSQIRRNTGWGWSLSALLRSLKDHEKYTPEDSLVLCRGYAPFARMKREEES